MRTRNIPDVTELHDRIANLESELQSSRQNMKKQEKLILALKQVKHDNFFTSRVLSLDRLLDKRSFCV
jgi:hypothetical protein